MSGWRGVVVAVLLGIALAVGMQPVAHDPAPEPWVDVQLPTLGGAR